MIRKKSIVSSFLMNSILLITLIVFVSVILIYINGQRRISRQSEAYRAELTAFKKTLIKDEIDIVVALINARLNQTRRLAEGDIDRARRELLSWINTLRLREDQYVAVNTMDGIILAHYKAQNIGKNMWDFTDKDGVKAVQEATRIAQTEDGGFISYLGSIRPSTGKPGRKITYAKAVPEWGWVVLTGVYLDDIETAAAEKRKELEKHLRRDLVNVVAVFIGSVLVFFGVARLVSNRLKSNLGSLVEFFDTAAAQTIHIDPNRLHFSEFKDLAALVNQMIDDIKNADAKLRRHRHQLEEQVKERTAELKREIEKQKKAQQELVESEATLRSVFRAAPVGIGMVVDRVFTQVNARIVEMTGYTKEELVGRNARMLYLSDEDYQAVGRNKYDQISAYGIGSVETRWQCKNGKVIDILLSSVPVNSVDLTEGVTFTVLDITEQKKSSQALKDSEAKFRRFFESLMDVYFETGLDGTIFNVSPSSVSLSGYTPDELVGKNVAILYNDPEDRQMLLDELKREGKVRGFELLFKKKTGELYDVSVNADITADDDGVSTGLLGTIRDVTREKELERRLQRSKKMESIGLMAGGIAHDLNNILSGIVSYPELLLMDMPADSPFRRPVEVIMDSGHRAADVVSDLLTIAKGVAAAKEVLSLNGIIEEYIESGEFKKLRQDHPDVVFHTELDSGLLNISCSSPHMKKLLMNLVSNAAEAIDRVGRVFIKTSNRYLDKPLKGYEDIQTGEYVLLTISDNGSGISRNDMERIFEPFYTKKVMGRSGTGLGLAVVWNTVQDHDGCIHVDSGEQGTVFELYFPVTRVDAVVKGQPLSIDTYRGSGEHILVVDDEENQREIACGLLIKLNYAAVSVPSGEAAVAYLQDHEADLVVLDMIMPGGINGRETYEQIKKIRPGQKAIIASGFAETREVKAAQQLGAGTYVKKPYTLEKIGLAIKAELEKAVC